MDGVLLVAFWGAASALAYAWVGYPLLAVVVGSRRRREPQRADCTPHVSFVVAARDEERCIGGKLRNTLRLDYPADRLQIVVASDGSVDDTDAIVSRFVHRNVRLVRCPRRGKVAALGDAVAASTGDILVFSDANTLLHRMALRNLVRSFADEEIGGVCGNQRHLQNRGKDTSGAGERLFWRFDRWLKSWESRTGSIVSADGALYAVRRELFRAPPPWVNDDFAISTAVVASGKRLVWEADAVVWEPTSDSAEGEFRRKVRIVSRGLLSVSEARALLNPLRYGFYSVVLFSHKVLRRLTPVFVIVLVAASVGLASRANLYAITTGAATTFLWLAVAGWATRRTAFGASRWLSAPFFICLGSAAGLVGIAAVLRGARAVDWQPARSASTRGEAWAKP